VAHSIARTGAAPLPGRPAGYLGRLRSAPLALALRDVLLAVACTAAILGIVVDRQVVLGYDSHAYWAAWQHGVYSAGPGQRDAFLYSPAFAQAMRPLALLPWGAFLVLWTASSAGIFAWLLKPLGWWLGSAAFALCLPAILMGNITALLALVLVIGFRHPSAWALPLLAKVTPAVGIVWFLARREWRPALVALGVAAAIAAVSLAIAPGLWQTWAHLLIRPASFNDPHRISTGSQLPLAPRLAAAIALTVFAARSDRRALLPVAAAIATPVFWAPMSLTVLAARRSPARIPRLNARYVCVSSRSSASSPSRYPRRA
jgi:hypothetical protein